MDQRGQQRRHALAKVRIVGEKQASNGGMSILTSSAMRCRASRRAFWNVDALPVADALADDRIGGGHPEGLFEAGPTSIAAMRRRLTPRTATIAPSCKTSGIRTSKPAARRLLVEQCVKSADAGSQWVDFTLP